jgi:hypothetical protein
VQQPPKLQQQQRQSVAQQRTDKDQPAPAKAEAPQAKWPEKAQFAVVSMDGHTVALMDHREIVVIRDGKEIRRIKSVNQRDPDLAISPDGSYVAAQAIWKKSVVLINVDSGVERDFHLREMGSRFGFTKLGDLELKNLDGYPQEVESIVQTVVLNSPIVPTNAI